MGQLGLGDTKDRFCPTMIPELSGHNVVKVFILILVCRPIILDRQGPVQENLSSLILGTLNLGGIKFLKSPPPPL